MMDKTGAELVGSMANPFKLFASRSIYAAGVKDGMPDLLARFLVGQSKFETNNYQNDHCKDSLCYFSYMYDKRSKWQVPGGGAIADNKAKVAKYKTLEDSVHEMTDWIKRRQRAGTFPKDLNEIKTPGDYAKLLQDTGFFQGWKKYTIEQNLKFYTDGIAKGMVE